MCVRVGFGLSVGLRFRDGVVGGGMSCPDLDGGGNVAISEQLPVLGFRGGERRMDGEGSDEKMDAGEAWYGFVGDVKSILRFSFWVDNGVRA